MKSDFVKQFLQDPTMKLIGAGVAIAALIGIVVISLIVRRRKRARLDEQADEPASHEHEERFVATIENLPYSVDPLQMIQAIAATFRQYLSVNPVAVYAAQGSAALYRNILGATENTSGWVATISADFMRRFPRTQLVSSGVFRIGGSGTGALPPLPAALAQGSTQPGREFATQPPPSLGTAPGAPINTYAEAGRSVAVLPWQGPFEWKGLILCESQGPIDMDSLARVYQPQGHVGGHVAVALQLEKWQLSLRIAGEQSSRITEFVNAVMEAADGNVDVQSVLKSVARFLGGDSSAYWTVDLQSRTLRMVAAFGFDPQEFLPVPLGQGLSGKVAESGEPIFVEDAPADPRCLFPGQCREAGICSFIGVPVSSAGNVMGVLEVYTRAPKLWDITNVFSLEAGAVLVGSVVSGTLGRDKTAGDSWLRAESAYMKLSEAVHGLQSRDEVLESAVEVLGHALGASRTIAIELDERMGSRAYGVKYEYRAPDIAAATGLAFSEEFAAGVFTAAKSANGPVVLNSSQTKSLMSAGMVSRLNVMSEIAVPIKLNGEVRALLYVHQCDHLREWAPEEIEFAGRIGHQVSLALASLRTIEKAAKESEMARTEAQRAAEAGARARGLIDALPEPVIGLDKEGRLTFFNGAGRHRLKLRNEDLGRMANMTEALTLEDESLWDRVNTSDSVAHFETQIAPPRVTAQLAAPDRTLAGAGRSNARSVPISIAVAPVRNDKGEITGRIVVLSDLSHLEGIQPKDPAAEAAELKKKVEELEASLGEARRVIETAAGPMPSSAEEGQAATEPEGEFDKVKDDEARARRAAQQLLEINRLKSDFIVNAGRELDASLQSVLGFAELLGQGSYGALTPEQLEAVKSIYAWARRMKSDVDWLLEYGSTRSRRLETGSAGAEAEEEKGAAVEASVKD